MSADILSLSISTGFYAVRRLAEEARARDIRLSSFEYRDLRFLIEGGRILIDTGPDTPDIRTYTHFLYRLSGDFAAVHHAALYATLQAGHVLNAQCLRRTVGHYSKLLQHLWLSEAGLPTIPTRVTGRPDTFRAAAVETMGKAGTALFKPVAGGRGDGIVVADTDEEVEGLDLVPSRTLIQDYLPVSSDYRVLVIGGAVLGAIERKRPETSLVSNVSQGGIAVEAEPGEAVIDLAARAATALGVEFAGVDILLHDGEPYVLEVNVMPQFEGFENATGKNVAGALLDYVVALA